MNLRQQAKFYERKVSFIYSDKSNVTLKWITKYPFTCSNRKHMFQIIKDILKRKPCHVIGQGSAEGIDMKLLEDKGFTTLTIDSEPEFKLCWNVLGISGIIGDCGSLGWWDGSKYDVIIAGVWAACKGDKGKMTVDKKNWLSKIRNNWNSILASRGVVYFDVNRKKYPILATRKIMSKKFSTEIFKTSPRILLKCQKFS